MILILILIDKKILNVKNEMLNERIVYKIVDIHLYNYTQLNLNKDVQKLEKEIE
jgi:hypothetical protein